jgi:cytochrome d ubiquinol oxidase subunit I
VIGWHIVLPAFTVGLASYIALLEGLRLATGRRVYLQVATFWTRIFAVAFGMGVVTGVVMPFQFGTNWSGLTDAAANVIGPLMAYEGVIAFFLEAAFLGVLLFGRPLVPPWVHFVAAVMVALGALFSSFWILATNSWMQTPAGYALADGRFMRAIGLRSSSTLPFPIALPTPSSPFTSRPALSCSGSAPTRCGPAGFRPRGG